MNLIGIELSAIANLAMRMAQVDGHVDPKEIDAIATGFRYFNVPVEQAKTLILLAAAANESDAMAVVAQMSDEHKGFVAAWLATIVAADGVIDERELRLLRHYSEKCGIPLCSPEEALRIIKQESTPPVPPPPPESSFNDFDDGFDMGPMFIAEDPICMVDRAFNWDIILGYGVRPYDVINELERQNKLPGPYTWELACQVAKIVKLGLDFRGSSLVSKELFEKWFYDRFSYVIKKEKMEGARRPEPPKPKGFWGSLFG